MCAVLSKGENSQKRHKNSPWESRRGDKQSRQNFLKKTISIKVFLPDCQKIFTHNYLQFIKRIQKCVHSIVFGEIFVSSTLCLVHKSM